MQKLIYYLVEKREGSIIIIYSLHLVHHWMLLRVVYYQR